MSAQHLSYRVRDKIPMCCGTCMQFGYEMETGLMLCQQHGTYPDRHGVCPDWGPDPDGLTDEQLDMVLSLAADDLR